MAQFVSRTMSISGQTRPFTNARLAVTIIDLRREMACAPLNNAPGAEHVPALALSTTHSSLVRAGGAWQLLPMPAARECLHSRLPGRLVPMCVCAFF